MQLSRSAYLYVTAVVSLSACITAYCLWRYPVSGDITFWLKFLAFVPLIALSNRYGLRLTTGSTIHADTIPLFAAILVFNPAEAVILTGLGYIAGQIKLDRLIIRKIFNIAQTMTYVGISALLVNAFTATPWMPQGWAAWAGIAAGALAMYLFNWSLVAGIVSLERHLSFFKLWLTAFEPLSLGQHAIMLGCGLLAALVITPYPWAIVLAAWPLIAVFITLDRSLRMEAQQKQLAEQNAGLAAHLAEQTEQLRIDIAERQKVEQKQSSMTAGLRAVAAVTDELIACPDVNTLFRRAVELAREKLGLERCAIFLEEGGYMRGTFGTDRYGRTTDERAQRWPVNQAWMERLEPSTPQGPRWIVVQEPHREWDGQKTVQIGEGWIVITPILSAHRPIGILVNDTAISHTALDTVKQEIVATFCSSLGNITERKRAEEEILQRNKALTALNQAGQALNKLAGPSEILHLIYTTIGLVLDNSNFYIALYDEEKQFVSFPVYSIDGNQDISGAGRPFGNGLTEYVIRTKTPLLIPHNLTETTEALGIAPIGRRAESFLAVPILVGEKVIGVIALQNYDRPDAYNTTHVELLSTFASQAAIALENARLFSLLTLEKEQLELLYRLSRQLTESLDMRTVAQRALEGVCAIVGALRGTVWVREPDPSGDSDLLLQVAVSGDNVEWAKAAAKQSVLRVGQGLAGWVAAQRQPSVVDDVTKNDQWINVPGLDDGIRATMNVPLLSGEELVGVLSLYSDQVASFDESSRRLAESIAGPVAVAMANARLFQAEREQSRRLQESQTQLIQVEKMAALGRLVASIAHEINNPLQAVQGSLTLAEEELEGRLRREKMARYLSMAEKEVERIANIVRRLRDFYRPSRQGTLPTDLHTVLASVLAMTGNQLQNNNVVVEREWADGLPLVQANPDQLKHVFLNLALNAADAMAERGGTLRVRTALDQLPTQGGKEPLPAARIEFGDTGTGIPPEILPHIFEPFVTTQPDKPTSTPDKTALGLSISYAIIQTHGGQLTVTSEVGVGTTFTILLPVSVA